MFKNKPSTSKAGQIDTTDLKKLGKDALIVGVGAAFVYAIEHISSVNLGDMTLILVPMLTIALNTAYKYFTENIKTSEEEKKV